MSSRSSKSDVLSSCNCSRTCVLNEWSDLSSESPLGPPSPLPRTRVDLAHEVSLASAVIFFETISSISLSRPSNYSKNRSRKGVKLTIPIEHFQFLTGPDYDATQNKHESRTLSHDEPVTVRCAHDQTFYLDARDFYLISHII